MTDEHALDDAVHVALDRTLDAQTEVVDEIAERDVPDLGHVATVVNRAEDLEVLVEESSEATRRHIGG